MSTVKPSFADATNKREDLLDDERRQTGLEVRPRGAHLRLRHERTADRDHLLLAARKRAGELAAALEKARKQRVDPLAAFRVMAARLREEGADAQILLDRQLGEEPPVLGNMGDAGLDDAMRRQACERAPLEGKLPRGGAQHPGNDAHQRGFAGTVRPDDADRLAGGDLERNIEQGAKGAVAGADASQAQHRPSLR